VELREESPRALIDQVYPAEISACVEQGDPLEVAEAPRDLKAQAFEAHRAVAFSLGTRRLLTKVSGAGRRAWFWIAVNQNQTHRSVGCRRSLPHQESLDSSTKALKVASIREAVPSRCAACLAKTVPTTAPEAAGYPSSCGLFFKMGQRSLTIWRSWKRNGLGVERSNRGPSIP